MALELSYVLPLKTGDDEDVTELVDYVRRLATTVDDVIVVDGSSPDAVERHRHDMGPSVRVLEPEQHTTMGKVGNVLTGISAARHEHVVIGDDDVRYTADQLARMDALLAEATVVRPQNHFGPLPWHAWVDTARTLLTRVSGGDWPGTLGVRRSAVLAVGGYDGEVLFENLELVRTLVTAGGTERLALDLVVRRIPPTTAHFWGQQIRQAYDELARPARLAVFLAVLPAVALAARRRRIGALAAGWVATAALAEVGRRRAEGRHHFAASATVAAGPWVVWRSLCSWVAVGSRLRGGVRYRDVRLRRAATPVRRLRQRVGGILEAEAGRADHAQVPA